MSAITHAEVVDLRFPTSEDLAGSDAMNPDGDYSAAYVILRTDEPGVAGFGFTFDIGRGNELCVLAAQTYAARLVGRDVHAIVSDLGATYRDLASDSQMRWLGPEKGVVHLALAAVMNACWDLAARKAGLPLWKYLASMTPAQLVDAADLRYVSDVVDRDRALAMLSAQEPTRAERIAKIEESGYAAYTTSPGWIGYTDDQMVELTQQARRDGFTHVKYKVGRSLDEDLRRLELARQALGEDGGLLIDANQVWDVGTAIEWVNALQRFRPVWIEEPTSPDDVLGHATIRRAVAPTGVASGEHCHNRVMFKQFFQAEGLDYCQLDACRLASVNEVLTVLLLAAVHDVPVCPHAGGVGLCELVQHLAMFDFVAVSGTQENRMIEYVDHLHEHFEDPVRVENGRYLAPELPGYSSRIFDGSIDTYRFPDGVYWSSRAVSRP